MENKKIVPPDGGWGWVIVFAYALNNVIMVPILQGFSLVLKEVFKNLNTPATESTIIMSINSAFGMGVGLFHGPLLRNFGYRKIALIGSIIFAFGITMTAFAGTFAHFMITYSLMASLGVGLTMSAFSLAINSYFVQKRGRAVGLAMTVTGLGPILMPLLISYLLSSYGAQGTIVILGGLTLHCLVGSLLLQPVKWHAKSQVFEPENEGLNSAKESANVDDSLRNDKDYSTLENEVILRERKSSTSLDKNVEETNDLGRQRSGTLTNGIDHPEVQGQASPYKWWNSGKSIESVNLGSSSMIFDENVKFGPLVIDDVDEEDSKSLCDDCTVKDGTEIPRVLRERSLQKEVPETSEIPEKVISDDSCWRSSIRRIVRFFDFDLLRDPIYVNMMLGMSIALFAEINFALLTPFILEDMRFSNKQIAIVMSTLAGVDLGSRCLGPFIVEWLKIPSRHVALISLFLLICFRSLLIFSSSFASVILVAIGLGFAKGLRSVNMALVIPDYIPIERLASATGIQMIVNAIVLISLGPFLGLSKDTFGSYVPCLILINSTTALTLIMWCTEMCLVRKKTKKQEKQYEQVDVRE